MKSRFESARKWLILGTLFIGIGAVGGTAPVSNSHSITPNAHQSTVASYSSRTLTSGGRYASVPPVLQRLLFSSADLLLDASSSDVKADVKAPHTLHNPKSTR